MRHQSVSNSTPSTGGFGNWLALTLTRGFQPCPAASSMAATISELKRDISSADASLGSFITSKMTLLRPLSELTIFLTSLFCTARSLGGDLMKYLIRAARVGPDTRFSAPQFAGPMEIGRASCRERV